MRLVTAGCISFSLWAFIACQTNDNKSNSAKDTILFKDSLGHTISKTDLANVTGLVNYEIIGTGSIDSKAQSLHQEAREFGQAGKYDLSIAKLEEAIKIQPTWAYPVYDLAYTYLLKGDFENALRFYRKTDSLEPKGFFTTKTALYSLEGEKAGKFSKGLYLAYLQIEWNQEINKKIEIAQAITQKVPDYAPAWKDLANLSDDKTAKLHAIEAGLSKDPDPDTKGILIINKAVILNAENQKEEAKNLLGNLIFSPDITTGNLELAKFTLKTISEN